MESSRSEYRDVEAEEKTGEPVSWLSRCLARLEEAMQSMAVYDVDGCETIVIPARLGGLDEPSTEREYVSAIGNRP